MIRLLSLFGCLFLGACSQSQWPLANGDSLTWSDLRGDWVVINYWAPWCKPCIQEIPELNHLSKSTVVLGVNFDLPAQLELQQQMTTLGVAFPVLLHDPAAELGYPRPQALPTTLLFDAEGRLRHTLIGPQTEERLTQLMKSENSER